MQHLNRLIGRNYGHPRGLVGRLTARLMRQGNAELNRWVVGLLDVAPDARVLEVGFGPGVALAALLARTPEGFVAGVDASALMVHQARTRQAAALAAGRLDVRQGDASALPYRAATFDRACGTHVIYFWADPVAAARELRRVLRPGGLLALGYQQRAHMPAIALRTTGQIAARLYGPGEVEAVVRTAGFTAVRLETLGNAARPDGFCVLATNGPAA
jgi:ubiquinone/menaquinone biosynthesis C-methylase UbiE